jgi:serine/threonine-protein kinase
VQGSASVFDEGRFGPVYRSHDPETNQPVLVRTFTLPLTAEEQARLVDALRLLCESPLDHQSIARPLVAGVEDGRPFLVHTLLPGESLQRFLAAEGPLSFADVVLRVTQLAAAIDFAAAAGVYHGDLGTRDVIVAPDSTGISGFGVIQALMEAGVHLGLEAPTRAGDVEALARVAFEMIQGRAPQGAREAQSVTAAGADTALLQLAFGAAFSKDSNLRPQSALEFAAALQHASGEPGMLRSTSPAMAAAATQASSGPSDLLLRQEREALDGFASEDPPLRGDDRSTAVPDFGRQEPTMPASMFAAVSAGERPRESSSGWSLVAAALAIGIFSGFAGGYIVGQRGEPLPVPRFAAEAVQPSPAAPAAAASTAGVIDPDAVAGPRESGTAIPESDISSRDLKPGSDVTAAPRETLAPAEASRPPAPTEASPAARADAPSDPPVTPDTPGSTAAPETTSAQEGTPEPGTAPASEPRLQAPPAAAAGPRVPPETPGGLQILSRPAGADVFVDGALVGRTPLLMASVPPGAHEVRIELPGHRRWATSVRVEPGGRARVAASLEQ